MRLIAVIFVSMLSTQAFGFDSIHWFFNCPTDPISEPQVAQDTLLLVGPGPHAVNRAEADGKPVTVSGRVCPTEAMERDVVLVIDVSGSMWTNDRQRRNANGDMSCGRHDAFLTLLDKLETSPAKVGVLTFSTSVMASTNGLIDSTNRDEIINQITNNNPDSLMRTLCGNHDTTSYVSALNKAETMLGMGRDQASKEVFFLTDGEPDNASAAQRAAESIRDGVTTGQNEIAGTIAGLFLGRGGNGERFLRDTISSTDANGDAIYARASDASQLAETLDELSTTELIGAQFKHGGSNAAQMNILDIMNIMDDDFAFELAPFNVAIDADQDFYEALFEYWDEHMNLYSRTGHLIWIQ